MMLNVAGLWADYLGSGAHMKSISKQSPALKEDQITLVTCLSPLWQIIRFT